MLPRWGGVRGGEAWGALPTGPTPAPPELTPESLAGRKWHGPPEAGVRRAAGQREGASSSPARVSAGSKPPDTEDLEQDSCRPAGAGSQILQLPGQGSRYRGALG